ncbi:MAG: flagella basal body P-ring formation protein FlgA [Deltaproteobacteria bacterium]|nr:flagella basal body P-ring formation protein FlgA [Deltaproteobacteria bacterium]
MTPKIAALALVASLLGWSTPLEARARAAASARRTDEVRRVDVAAARIHLGDLVAGLGELAEIDLGPAPAPGTARLITREELTATLEGQGVQGLPPLPGAVRVHRKVDVLDPKRLRSLATEAIEAASPRRGIALRHLEIPQAVKVASGWERVIATVPRAPHRAGEWTTTVTLAFELDGQKIARVAVPASFDVSPEAARPTVMKGETLTLLVRSGLVEIAARATANDNADVGDRLLVALRSNGKVVRARLVSPERAVLEGRSP